MMLILLSIDSDNIYVYFCLYIIAGVAAVCSSSWWTSRGCLFLLCIPLAMVWIYSCFYFCQ